MPIHGYVAPSAVIGVKFLKALKKLRLGSLASSVTAHLKRDSSLIMERCVVSYKNLFAEVHWAYVNIS